MPDRPAILALDIGTSSLRCAVIGGDGGIDAEARRDRPDGAELDFDAGLMWRQACELIGEVAPGVRRRVHAVCIAGHVGTVFLDRTLRPLGPGRGWADVDGVDQLAELLGPDRDQLLAATGRPGLTGGALAASAALRAGDPVTFGQVRHIVSPKDFVNARLTGGVIATDHTTAAYTGASDVAARRWSTPILARTGLALELLPRQVASTAVLVPLHASVAVELGLNPDVLVVAGGPDGTVGATPILQARPDLIVDIAGTTDALVQVIDHPGPVPGAAVLNPYPIAERWTIGGPTGMTGGALLHWMQLFGPQWSSASLADIERTVSSVEPGSDGLLIDPALSGSRFPRWEARRRGSVRGQSERHGVAHFLRAAVEGAAYEVRQGLDVLDPDRRLDIAMAGGQARAAAIAQIRADVWNRCVHVSAELDLTLRGAGVLGQLALDPSIELADCSGTATTYRPDPACAASYDRFYQHWLG